MTNEPGGNLPRKRASHVTRQEVADFLAAAYADGQLNTSEYDERTAQVWSATFTDELEPLTADLSSVARRETAPSQSTHSDALAYLTDQPGGFSFSFAAMGGTEKTGDWQIAPAHSSIPRSPEEHRHFRRPHVVRLGLIPAHTGTLFSSLSQFFFSRLIPAHAGNTRLSAGRAGS